MDDVCGSDVLENAANAVAVREVALHEAHPLRGLFADAFEGRVAAEADQLLDPVVQQPAHGSGADAASGSGHQDAQLTDPPG